MSENTVTLAQVYEYDETISVEIPRAIVRVCDADGLLVEIPGHSEWFKFPADSKVRRLIPAEGEPQAGEVWRDSQGRTWFVHTLNDNYGNKRLEMTCSDPTVRSPEWPAEVVEQFGPLRRIFSPTACDAVEAVAP